MYIEQCHYVHKIGIALSSPRIPLFLRSMLLFSFIREDFNLFYQLVNHYTSIYIFPTPHSPDNFLVEQSVI